MTNLIERLRDNSWRDGRTMALPELEVWDKTCREAADEIERLAGEVERLEGELRDTKLTLAKRNYAISGKQGWKEEFARLEAENKRLREALAEINDEPLEIIDEPLPEEDLAGFAKQLCMGPYMKGGPLLGTKPPKKDAEAK